MDRLWNKLAPVVTHAIAAIYNLSGEDFKMAENLLTVPKRWRWRLLPYNSNKRFLTLSMIIHFYFIFFFK